MFHWFFVFIVFHNKWSKVPDVLHILTLGTDQNPFVLVSLGADPTGTQPGPNRGPTGAPSRQASGGLRAEILHLQQVKQAVNAMPPEAKMPVSVWKLGTSRMQLLTVLIENQNVKWTVFLWKASHDD